MARIPMKGDYPSLNQLVSSGELKSPTQALAEMYFESVDLATASDVASEKQEYEAAAEKCRKSLAKFGFKPVRIDGIVKVQR